MCPESFSIYLWDILYKSFDKKLGVMSTQNKNATSFAVFINKLYCVPFS